MTKHVKIIGQHDENTLAQFARCMEHDSAVAGVLCADGHLGYSQPVGAAIAYEDHISVSGVGYDIACGNLAVRFPVLPKEIKPHLPAIVSSIQEKISFGVGRTNNTKVENEIFEVPSLWEAAGATDLRDRAIAQFGTIGSGNHYVDIFESGDDVWVGVHFGSRGLGHTLATRFLKEAGGKDGIDQPPTLVNVNTDIGERYMAALDLCGWYAYESRKWVVNTVADTISVDLSKEGDFFVHNHHNSAWNEEHFGKQTFVARKGCTPNHRGFSFVGGSMGDDSVILAPTQNQTALEESLRSTIHGAGRVMGRKQAKRLIKKEDVDAWLQKRGVYVSGGDLDESPFAYRRLNEVLEYHKDTVEVLHRLRPMAVLMAGPGEFDPYKD